MQGVERVNATVVINNKATPCPYSLNRENIHIGHCTYIVIHGHSSYMVTHGHCTYIVIHGHCTYMVINGHCTCMALAPKVKPTISSIRVLQITAVHTENLVSRVMVIHEH